MSEPAPPRQRLQAANGFSSTRELSKSYVYVYFFFLSGFSFTDTDDSQDSRGREETFFYSILPLPPAHEHLDIYLLLCM